MDAVWAESLFILQTTYAGHDRYKRQNMHDNITISYKVEYPDIFSDNYMLT